MPGVFLNLKLNQGEVVHGMGAERTEKHKKIKRVLVILAAILLIGWCLLPSAAELSGLTEYASNGISRIVLVPRPGSDDPKVEITEPEEIAQILSWFSSVKVRPGIFGGGGSGLAVVFHADEDSLFRIDITEMRAYHMSGPSGRMVSILPILGSDIWDRLLPT